MPHTDRKWTNNLLILVIVVAVTVEVVFLKNHIVFLDNLFIQITFRFPQKKIAPIYVNKRENFEILLCI